MGRERSTKRLQLLLLLSSMTTAICWGGFACDSSGPEATTSQLKPPTHEAARPSRIILFSMDTVRADRIGGYSDQVQTPEIDRISAEGVRFERFYGASTYTIPSHMSMLTGLDPREHGVHLGYARLAPQVPTLAETLSRQGYMTQGFHEGGFVAPRFGFDRGFTDYQRLPLQQLVGTGLPGVLDWIRDHQANDYFLFLHTYAAHYPYGGFDRYREEHPERGLPDDAELERLRQQYPRRTSKTDPQIDSIDPEVRYLCTLYNQMADSRELILGCGDHRPRPEFFAHENFERDRAAIMESYDQRIRRIDTAIGRIRRLLEDLGQWEDTLLILTSDHGEGFYEHDVGKHGWLPFNEVVKVPLIVSYPRLMEEHRGAVVPGVAWHLDLLPTVLSLAGAGVPTYLKGMDLTGVLAGVRSIPDDRVIFPAVLRTAHLEQKPLRRVIVRGDDKVIQGHPDFGDPAGLLFDLSRDREEESNLRELDPTRFAGLADALSEYEATLNPVQATIQTEAHKQDTGRHHAPNDPLELSDEELERLRALGYVE